MSNIKSYVLPIAIILGSIFHSQCASLAFLNPYCIFMILMLNFVAVNLRGLRLKKLDYILMGFQTFVSVGLYLLFRLVGLGEIMAQGAMIGVLCPVAASVVVIACMLGANREMVTTYTIAGYLLVAVLGPIYFSFIGTNQELLFWESFLLILGHISPILALPFFLSLILEMFFPGVRSFLARYKGWSFPIWAFVLMVCLGQTFDYIFLHGKGQYTTIAGLGILAVLICFLQFFVGKKIGRLAGDSIAGGQLLGQKNSAMGIWLANIYLNPLTAVFFAFYSICQNLFNSIQLWQMDHKKK